MKRFLLVSLLVIAVAGCVTHRPIVDMQGRSQKMYNIDLYQ